MNRLGVLPRETYEPTADVVAPALLGHLLVRKSKAGICAGVIVETEAYLCGDAACHAFNGPTPRNKVMFEEPGHAYVYFIYGCHWCVNAVCRPKGQGEAVLIRAIQPVMGLELMQSNRPGASGASLANGPGKLCQAMRIDRELNGADLCDVGSRLYIAVNRARESFIQENGPIGVTVRIGLNKAADLPLRFVLERNAFVSRGPRSRRERGQHPLAPVT